MSHLRTLILTSRFWVVFKYYVGQRRGTLVTLLISLVVSLLIVCWIYKLYSPVESWTHFSLQGTSEYDISNVEIYIEYNQRGEDKITAYVSLTPTSNDVIGKDFFLTKSTNLTYQREGSFFAGLEYSDCRPNFSMCFRFKDSTRRTMILNFIGNAFGHGSQEERLDFGVDISKNGAVQSVPVKLVVSNLSEVNIGTIVPEPTEKGVGGVLYKFEPNNGIPNSNNVIISGVNRQSIYSTQFELFLLGTFLGIVVSLITTIFLEFIQKYESNEVLQ